MGVEISFAPVTEQDILELVERLLPADRLEILALGHDPEWAIRNSVATSDECGAIRGNGRLACLLGVCQPTALGPEHRPWLLSTEEILIHRVHCLRISRLVFNRWKAKYPYMVNWVDTRHTRAVNWLRWLGMEMDPPEPHGPFGRPFHRFYYGDPSCA